MDVSWKVEQRRLQTQNDRLIKPGTPGKRRFPSDETETDISDTDQGEGPLEYSTHAYSLPTPQSVTTATDFHLPSDREVKGYFGGLGNLIARSSDKPWTQVWPFPGRVPAAKRYSNIGHHPIVDIYDCPGGPRLQIRKVLKNHNIQWYTIDIVRIGYERTDPREHPVVVLVTANPATSPYIGANAVRECHEILVDNQLDDVHVEMLAGVCLRRVMESYDSTGVVPSYPYAWMPKLGESIGAKNGNEDPGAGSLGLYLKVGQDIMALTCHHVVAKDKRPVQFGQGDSGIVLGYPHPKDHKRLCERLVKLQANADRDLQKLRDLQKFSERGGKPLSAYQESQLENLGDTKMRHAADLAGIKKSFEDQPWFATVVASSGLLAKHAEHDNSMDWAIAQIDRSMTRGAIIENKFPPLDFRPKDIDNINRNLDVPFDPAAPLEVCEILAEQEVRKPTTTDMDGDPLMKVLKHGRTTGWTCGVSNEIRSCCNLTYEDCDAVVSTEWLILYEINQTLADFGDSGAVVMDLSGRVGGLLHTVSNMKDKAYATPIEWLLKDIAKATNLEVSILGSSTEFGP